MGDSGGFGFDPEDFDRVMREVSDGLRDALDRIGHFFEVPGDRAGWGALLDGLVGKVRSAPETAGEAGDGVWAIYTVGGNGEAHVEQVFATEIDALRANRNNTDPTRKVRFLPYGIAVGVLDDPDLDDPDLDGPDEV
ncbi:MAG TPA: hypothetical protein VFR17_13185 [Mycobacterium sp.]|nr:hypothetical protein [Mycobacterium sp.]